MRQKTGKGTKGRLRSSYISSIISIALVLFTLGVLGILLVTAQRLSTYLKENIGFTVYLQDNISYADATYLKKMLDASPYAKSAQFFSKDEAAQQLVSELGEDFFQYLGYNPLSAYIDLRLNARYANADSIPKVEAWIKAFPQVAEVEYQKTLVNLINENVNRVGLVVLLFSALMLFIALVLINNTIRLSVYSKRFLINTMKLVGATRSFIRRPFLVKSILHALYASVIAIGLLVALLYGIHREFADLLAVIDPIYFVFIFAAITAIGIFINLTATFFAVNKFLRLSADDLYY